MFQLEYFLFPNSALLLNSKSESIYNSLIEYSVFVGNIKSTKSTILLDEYNKIYVKGDNSFNQLILPRKKIKDWELLEDRKLINCEKVYLGWSYSIFLCKKLNLQMVEHVSNHEKRLFSGGGGGGAGFIPCGHTAAPPALSFPSLMYR